MSNIKENMLVNNFGIDKEIEGDYLKWNYFWNLFQMDNLKFQDSKILRDKYNTMDKTICSEIVCDSIREQISSLNSVNNCLNTFELYVDLSKKLVDRDNNCIDNRTSAKSSVSYIEDADKDISVYSNIINGIIEKIEYLYLNSCAGVNVPEPNNENINSKLKIQKVKSHDTLHYNLSYFYDKSYNNYFRLSPNCYLNKEKIKKVNVCQTTKGYSFEDLGKNGVEISKIKSSKFKGCNKLKRSGILVIT